MVRGTWHHRRATRWLAVAAILALASCSSVNPVHWYHGVFGSKPAAPPAEADTIPTPSSGSSEEPYPILASVPTPATKGLTDAQRAALADGLVADHAHAVYAEQQERVADAVPLPPAFDQVTTPLSPGPDLSSPPPPPPVHKVRAHRSHPPRPPEETHPSPSAEDAALAASGLSAGDALGPVASGSPLTPRESPTPEAASPLPPQPSLPPVPTPAPAAAAAPPPTGPAPVVPQAPQLAAVPQVQAPAGSAPLGGSPVMAAAIHFSPGSTALPEGARATLAPVAGMLGSHGGKVHVISHAATGGDANATLAGYQTALARAKAVKKALVASGIPENRISAEVSSSISSDANDSAEVMVGQ
jgi:outer membrane protein OmpA-like peptidoglycan-associated protein